MNDPSPPNAAHETGPRSAEELTRLVWWVEGLLDADRLLGEDGDALLRALAAAQGAMEGGKVAAARRHTRQFCRGIEALVQCGMLEEAPGHAALDTAHHLLTELSGGEAPARPTDPSRTARDTQKGSLS
jgi:hypothetical protein